MKIKTCLKCNKDFTINYHLSNNKWAKRKFCTRQCHLITDDLKNKISISKKKNPTRYWLGKKNPKVYFNLIKNGIMKGENHYKWKKDRNTLAKRQERNDSAYQEWRRQVWKRDNWKCKIINSDCNGRIEAHHILSWTEYPELRYIINNGITLCHAHHPRKRAEEKRLSPFFMELVSVSK